MKRKALHVKRNSNAFTIVELLITVVVIGILATIVIVSYNGIVTKAKTASMRAELRQWKTTSEIYKSDHNITCPDNYAFVYGNAALNTDDFCVMKYEAKKDGSNNAVSKPDGTPWVSITQAAAITAANAVNGHLITEAEWMTIAANALSVKYNWSGGEVGSGYIYQGHINLNPNSALAASANDDDILNGITGGTGTTRGTNSSRIYWLTSGDAIWDFSGNVDEWTQQAIGVPGLTVSQVGIPGDTAFAWREYTNTSLSFGSLPAASRPSSLAVVDALTDIANWSSAPGTQGIGRIYTNYSITANRAFSRGSSWVYASNGGPLSLNLSNGISGSTISIGFRVVK